MFNFFRCLSALPEKTVNLQMLFKHLGRVVQSPIKLTQD